MSALHFPFPRSWLKWAKHPALKPEFMVSSIFCFVTVIRGVNRENRAFMFHSNHQECEAGRCSALLDGDTMEQKTELRRLCLKILGEKNVISKLQTPVPRRGDGMTARWPLHFQCGEQRRFTSCEPRVSEDTPSVMEGAAHSPPANSSNPSLPGFFCFSMHSLVINITAQRCSSSSCHGTPTGCFSSLFPLLSCSFCCYTTNGVRWGKYALS